MSFKNQIVLSNPFYTINGKEERKLLDKDIEFMKKHEIANRFIRRRIVFFMDGYRYAAQAMTKRWGINVSFFELGHDPIKKAYLTKNLEPEAAAVWWSMMHKDEQFSKKLVEELLNIIEGEKKLAKSIPDRDLSPAELEKHLFAHLDWWISFFEVAYLWFCIEDIKRRVDVELSKVWKDVDYKGDTITLAHFIEQVYRPMKFPLSSSEQRELMQVATLKGEEREKALTKHIARFHHLSLHNIDDEYFNKEYYESRLKIVDNSQEYAAQKKALEMADKELEYANELVKATPLPKWIKERIEFVRWFMFLRTESIDYFMLVNAAYKPVFQALAKIFNLSMEEVLHMTYEEILSSLRKGQVTIPKQVILDRTHHGYAYLISKHGSYLVTGAEIDELGERIVGKQEKKEINELHGQIAYKGHATGRARVIVDRRFAHRLETSEILVTTMTSPDFVPAMKRAAAIVTNEGGILCHAAIMSRELQKPCIIGTKNATDVFKTGDMLEVDANTGIVRRLP